MMNNEKALSRTVRSLPEVAVTRDGYQFCPHGDVWRIIDISKTSYFHFSNIREKCSDTFVTSLKQVMIWYLQRNSSSGAVGMFEKFRAFLNGIPEKNYPILEITSSHLLNYRSGLAENRQWHLGAVGTLLKHWHSLGYPGVHGDVPKLFDQLKIKGGPKGEAVRTMDPETGPFSDIELQSIQSALMERFASGKVRIEDYILVHLFISTGARSVQIAALKCKDLIVRRNEDGCPHYILQVPRAKQRGATIRSSFKPRPIVRDIGEVLEAWAEHVKETCQVEIADTGDLPVFPRWNCDSIPGFEHHADATNLGRRVVRVCNSFNVISERTGNALSITSRRFRYTLGTRAAEEGFGELVIAELLDHSDTQNVGVYVEATPAIADRIDKATAMQLAPIAQAFVGLIVDDEFDAERGDDLTSRISDPDAGGVGTCGKYGFCGGMAPIACYTCRNFQPWLDAPHAQILETLIADRERLLQSTDIRIASVNDRTILAVADVVNRCEAMREVRGELND